MSSFTIKTNCRQSISAIVGVFTDVQWIALISFTMAVFVSYYSYLHNYTVLYGDAESHLNIAKRVVSSLTPGMAQLGGIWLPLPHILLIPFIYSDWLWRTGLAGSIVSGGAFIIASVYIYRLGFLITKHKGASFIGALSFIANPNILYLQSTPLTELTLIVFFVLSTYYFFRFLLEDGDLFMLVIAAFFGFCASLSRYDGWALVMMEIGVLCLYYFPFRFKQLATAVKEKSFRERWNLLEGRVLLFATLGCFGIILWLGWGWLILGDPLYFTHSQFSANSQQMNWLAKGELPAYHNFFVAIEYYFFTSIESGGMILSLLALVGALLFAFNGRARYRLYILLILLVPFFFNVLTLFLGQSVIFLPGVTPPTFEWTLFNVRYGSMMIPVFAIFLCYLFAQSKMFGRALIIVVLITQPLLFLIGFSPVLSLDDGRTGLSSAVAKMPDAQFWLASNYDYGMLLTDDFARTISIIRTPVPMENVIYIGNKPYWEESLVEPQKYARWIVMQRNDTVWKNLNDRPEVNARLFKYFNKVYTSEDILIFRRISDK